MGPTSQCQRRRSSKEKCSDSNWATVFSNCQMCARKSCLQALVYLFHPYVIQRPPGQSEAVRGHPLFTQQFCFYLQDGACYSGCKSRDDVPTSGDSFLTMSSLWALRMVALLPTSKRTPCRRDKGTHFRKIPEYTKGTCKLDINCKGEESRLL